MGMGDDGHRNGRTSEAMADIDEAMELIRRGSDEILVETELVTKLKRGKPLFN